MIGRDQFVAWRVVGKRIATSPLAAARLVGFSHTACDRYLSATGAEAPIDAEVDAELTAAGFGPCALAALPAAEQSAVVALYRWRAIGPLLAEVAPTAFLRLLRAARDSCALLDAYPIAEIIAATDARLSDERGRKRRPGRKRKTSPLDDDSPIVWQSLTEALTAAASLAEAKGSRELVAWGHMVLVSA